MKKLFLFILCIAQIAAIIADESDFKPSLRQRSRGSSVEFGGRDDHGTNPETEIKKIALPSHDQMTKALMAFGKFDKLARKFSSPDGCGIKSPGEAHGTSPEDKGMTRCSSGGDEGCATSPNPTR